MTEPFSLKARVTRRIHTEKVGETEDEYIVVLNIEGISGMKGKMRLKSAEPSLLNIFGRGDLQLTFRNPQTQLIKS